MLSNLKVYKIDLKYKDYDWDNKREESINVIADSEEKAIEDAKKIFYNRVSNYYCNYGNDYSIEVKNVEVNTTLMNSEYEYHYFIRLQHEYSYSGKSKLNEIIELLTNRESAHYEVRHVDLSNVDKEEFIDLYHIRTPKKSEQDAIDRCMKMGIDPFGH